MAEPRSWAQVVKEDSTSSNTSNVPDTSDSSAPAQQTAAVPAMNGKADTNTTTAALNGNGSATTATASPAAAAEPAAEGAEAASATAPTADTLANGAAAAATPEAGTETEGDTAATATAAGGGAGGGAGASEEEAAAKAEAEAKRKAATEARLRVERSNLFVRTPKGPGVTVKVDDDDVNKVHVRLYEPPEGEEEVQLFDISQPPSKGPLNGWARRYDLLPHELIVNAAKTKALGGQCFKQAGQQTVKTTKATLYKRANSHYQNALGTLVRVDRHPKATAQHKLQVTEMKMVLLTNQALVLSKLKHWSKAVAMATEALQLDPGHKTFPVQANKALFRRAAAHVANDRYKVASRDIEAGIAMCESEAMAGVEEKQLKSLRTSWRKCKRDLVARKKREAQRFKQMVAAGRKKMQAAAATTTEPGSPGAGAGAGAGVGAAGAGSPKPSIFGDDHDERLDRPKAPKPPPGTVPQPNGLPPIHASGVLNSGGGAVTSSVYQGAADANAVAEGGLESELGGDGATSTDRLALTDEDTDTAKSGSSSKVWWGVVGALAIGGIALAAYAFSRKRGGSSASQRSTLRRGYR